MKRILYSIYTENYPSPNTGGPNHVIYDIVKNSDDTKYYFDYLSYTMVVNNINRNNIDDMLDLVPLNKKIVDKVYKNISAYRKIVSSSYYQLFHFFKRWNYFNRVSPEIDYDIVHSQDSIALKFSNKKMKKIITNHSKSPLSIELTELIDNKLIRNKIKSHLFKCEKDAFNNADIITFPSKAAMENYSDVHMLPYNSKDFRIIYNGVDLTILDAISCSMEIFENYDINKNNKLTILNVASHVNEKRITLILEVIKILIHEYKKELLFINIGTGYGTKEYIELADKFNIRESVVFLGQIPNNDVIRFMKSCDVFLMLSEKVIFDLVILEALASGICVIASNDGGNKEIIEDGVNGYLLYETDPHYVASKILSVDYNKTIQNGKKTIKNFTSQKMAENYFKLYDEIG